MSQMTMFSCKRCGYTTKYKHVLLKHLERTNVCEPTLTSIDVQELLLEFAPTTKPYTCCCGKGFSYESSLSRHRKSCILRKKPDSKDVLIEELKEKLAQAEKQIDTLKHQQTSNLVPQHVIGDYNNINNTVNNTYVVMVNNFGSEDISHVIEDKEFLDDCLKMLQTGIPNVVNRIYYDKTKPENKTVVLKSAKRKTALVHTGNGQWQEKDLNQVVPLMVRKGSRILTNHLIEKEVMEYDPEYDMDTQEIIDAKKRYIGDVNTQKRPEYDIVSSAVKANISNHR